MFDGYVQNFPDYFVSAEAEQFFLLCGSFYLGIALLLISIALIFDIFYYRSVLKCLRVCTEKINKLEAKNNEL